MTTSITVQGIKDLFECNGQYSFVALDSMNAIDSKTKSKLKVKKGQTLSNVRFTHYKRRYSFDFDNCVYNIDNPKGKLLRVYPDVNGLVDFEKLKNWSLSEIETEDLINFFLDLTAVEDKLFSNFNYMTDLDNVLDDVMKYYVYIRDRQV